MRDLFLFFEFLDDGKRDLGKAAAYAGIEQSSSRPG